MSSQAQSERPTATEAASPLALDHCACIVNDLAAGAARWERLGFTLTPESRQRGAVPSREGVHPWASANRCAVLGHSYLELVGIVDPGAFNPWTGFIAKHEGLHILALRAVNADAAYASLSARTQALQPPVPRERTVDVGGEPRVMRFRNIFSRDALWPEARYIVIEHQTPEYLWQPRYAQHDNGACDLVDVTFVADDPDTLSTRLETFGAAPVRHAQGLSARLPGRGMLHVMRADAYADAYGYLPAGRPAMHAMTVSFRDLSRTLDLLAQREVPVERSATHGHWLAPRETNGFVMRLVADGQS
jgi:hypothetical protein